MMPAIEPAPRALSAALSRFADDVTVVQKPGLLEAEVDGEIVALHIDSGKCYGMNEVSSFIWSMLAVPRSVEDVRALLLERYAVDEAECREQVALLLADLESEGLIAVS
jgi:hypothetical protein